MPSVSAKQRIPSREEIAWAAGIMCGEGSFGSHVMRGWTGVRLTVGQSSLGNECPEMLLRLQEIFGIGRIYEMGYRKHAHHKTIWQYYVHGFEKVQAMTAMMWYWLTPEKQAQATYALNAFHEARA